MQEEPLTPKITMHQPGVLRPLYGPTIFYVLFGVAGLLAARLFFQISLLGLGLYFFLGFALWTLTEYLFHRFAFHQTWYHESFQRWHNHKGHHSHTDDPQELVFPAPHSMMLYTPIILGLYGLTGNLGVTLALLPGFFAGYLYYEWLHFWIHFHEGNPRNPFLRWQVKNHVRHHCGDPNRRFGVIWPVWDFVFRTL